MMRIKCTVCLSSLILWPLSQVMNIGRRPTVSGAGETDVSVEVRRYLNV